jgi:polysaccharide pyruvyl transferase WcaK-like protein
MSFLNKIKIFTKRAYFLNHFPSLLSVIFSRKKKLIYYGFLGDGNFGDEMVFMATKNLFKDCVVIPYQRHMPFMIKLYCKLFNDNINGIIIGGGTIIRSFSADKIYYKKLVSQNKPVFFHGTGADEHLMDKVFWPSILTSDFYGGLRGPQSQLALEQIGFNFKQIGDAGLYLKESANPVKKKKVIIVNFGTHKALQVLLYSRSQIIEFLKEQVTKDYKIVYLPLHSIDFDLGKSLRVEIPELELLDIATSYKKTLELMSEAEFCIGERLHFIVMSILANTNFISINYDDKHADFLKSLDLENFGFSPNNITTKIIKKSFDNQVSVINWAGVNANIERLKLIHDSERDLFLD